MANVTRDRLGGAFSVLMQDAEGNAEALMQMALADPRLLPMLAQNEELKNEYVANAMSEDDTKPLQKAKEAGLLTKDNAFAELKEAVVEDRFPSGPAFKWFVEQFNIPPKEVAELIMNAQSGLDVETIAWTAKKVPFNKDALTELLQRLSDQITRMVRRAVGAPIKEPSSLRVMRKPVPKVVVDSDFHLLKAMYQFQMIHWSGVEAQLKKAQADLATLRDVKLSLPDMALKINDMAEDLAKRIKALEKDLNSGIDKDAPPVDRKQAEQMEKELQAAGWFLNAYEKQYGRDELAKALKDAAYGPDLPIALLDAYRRQAAAATQKR